MFYAITPGSRSVCPGSNSGGNRKMFKLIVVTLAAFVVLLQVYGDPARKPAVSRDAPEGLTLAGFVGLEAEESRRSGGAGVGSFRGRGDCGSFGGGQICAERAWDGAASATRGTVPEAVEVAAAEEVTVPVLLVCLGQPGELAPGAGDGERGSHTADPWDRGRDLGPPGRLGANPHRRWLSLGLDVGQVSERAVARVNLALGAP